MRDGLVVLAMLLVGCGGSDESEFCKGLATKVCAGRQKCLPLAFGDWNHSDMARCVAAETKICESNFALPGLEYSRQDLDSCLASMQETDCDWYLDGIFRTSACQKLKGSLKEGASCSVPGQCESGYCTATHNALVCGACATRPSGGAASNCSNDLDCDPELSCAGGFCSPRGAMGATCTNLLPCKQTLTCKAGTCQARVPDGGDCSTAECELEHVCKNGRCVPLTQAAAGAPCGYSMNFTSNCEAGFKCKRNEGASGSLGTCVAEVPQDGDCTGGYLFPNEPCVDGTECVNGRCIAYASYREQCGTPPTVTMATTCSPMSTTTASLTIINMTSRDVALLWINAKCGESSYGTVPVGARFFQGSYVGHLWVLRDPISGAILKQATVEAGGTTITLP